MGDKTKTQSEDVIADADTVAMLEAEQPSEEHDAGEEPVSNAPKLSDAQRAFSASTAEGLELQATEVHAFGGNPGELYQRAARHWTDAGEHDKATVCSKLADKFAPQKDEPKK